MGTFGAWQAGMCRSLEERVVKLRARVAELEAEVERLREHLDEALDDAVEMGQDLDEARAERDALAATVERVRQMMFNSPRAWSLDPDLWLIYRAVSGTPDESD